MSEKIKILISVLLVLGIVCFSGSVYVYHRSELLKDDLKKAEEDHTALKKQVSDQENLIKDKESVLQQMEASLKALEEDKKRTDEDARKVQTQLSEEISRRESAETHLQEKTAEWNSSKTAYESLQAEKAKLAAQIDVLNAERSQWVSQKNTLAGKLASVEAELAKLMEGKKDIELNTIVVKAPPPQAPSSGPEASQSLTGRGIPSRQAGLEQEKNHSLEGRVLIYNPEYDFVVIDLGGYDDIYEGKLFDVLDRDQIVGKVRVEKVYDRMSAAVIVEKSPQAVFRKNIIVKSQEI